MTEELKDTSSIPETEGTQANVTENAVLDSAEQAALLEFTDEEILDYTEGTLTKKETAQFLLLSPLVNAIIKFSLIGIGLIAAILWLITAIVPGFSTSMANSFYKGFTGVLAAINNILPFSVFEILLVLTLLGWLGYLVYVLVRFLQVHKKGKLLGYRMWIQFGYSTLAVVMVYTMLFSFGYGVASNRSSFAKAAAPVENPELYKNQSVYETELVETTLYMIDKLNTTVIDAMGQEPQAIYYRAKNGASKYSEKGSSTAKLTKLVNEAFKAAEVDYPVLKGSKINAKEALAAPIFTGMTVGSMYSPVTGEVLVNTYYPEVAIPMLVAKGIAKQRGFQNDAQADLIAYLVCTQYSDVPYIQYSGYFNAYLACGSKLAKRNSQMYATVASSLKECVKKEVIYYTKRLDTLYGNTNSLSFTDNGENVTANENYLVYPKLMINYYRNNFASYATEGELNCGYYVNTLVNLYRNLPDYQDQINETVAKYSEEKVITKRQEKQVTTALDGTVSENIIDLQ